MKSIEELMSPVSAEAPFGEDLDESLEFDRLRAAFDDNFPIDSGVSPLPEGEPGPPPVDWSEVFDLIEALCGQTKDLYLAVSYARCGIVRRDADVVDQGLQFAARLLEECWDGVHPVVDDPGGRLRGPIFEDIARRGAFAMPILDMPLILGSRSSIRGEQLLDAHRHGGASDDFAEVRMTLDQMDDEAKAATASLLSSYRDSIARIDTVLRDHSVADRPDFGTTQDTISAIEEAFLALAGLAAADSGDDPDGDDDGAMAAGNPIGGEASFGGAVKSRSDVLAALNAIEQYYSRAEPGHPMRMATGRLRSWVNKDFMEILEDIAPGSLDEVKSVLLERRDVE